MSLQNIVNCVKQNIMHFIVKIMTGVTQIQNKFLLLSAVSTDEDNRGKLGNHESKVLMQSSVSALLIDILCYLSFLV